MINDMAFTYNVCKSFSNSRSISVPRAIRKKKRFSVRIAECRDKCTTHEITQGSRLSVYKRVAVSACCCTAGVKDETFAAKTKAVAARLPDV